jgi:hypothetical protein
MQNPGARCVATSEQWRTRFERRIKEDAHPLVILAPMSPVLFVYDVTDTEGRPVPPALLNPFAATGTLSPSVWKRTLDNCPRDLIAVVEHEMAVNKAGKIEPAHLGDTVDLVIGKDAQKKPLIDRRKARYRLALNRKQDLPARYATLAHELAHLYCGHLGTPNSKWWPDRRNLGQKVEEFEAESVAYLLCGRLGIGNPSARYLSDIPICPTALPVFPEKTIDEIGKL